MWLDQLFSCINNWLWLAFLVIILAECTVMHLPIGPTRPGPRDPLKFLNIGAREYSILAELPSVARVSNSLSVDAVYPILLLVLSSSPSAMNPQEIIKQNLQNDHVINKTERGPMSKSNKSSLHCFHCYFLCSLWNHLGFLYQ